MKRIKIQVTATVPGMESVEEMIGYIDGCVRGGDKVPYACVVFPTFIEMVPMNCLRVLNDGTDLLQNEDIEHIGLNSDQS